ncbi:hypothetical protein C1M55_24095 [Rhodococcus qingshengii]|uniref:hypothetical protein n=1 Tax=Rhodococcus qingshengii TaxID=334542 RepID=UPI000C9FB9F9|nr:hypothetical protein [Rhodococcus qingshengii]AUS33874.1 hypothetical protein C1M55_24095 [Rhodococcus qingshengii]
MIGRMRAAWDEAGRLANHRRGTNPMTRDEWKSAEIRQGEILAHVEALGELGPDLLVAMKLQREFFDGLRKVLNGEGQVSDTLVLGESVALHGVVLSLLRVLAGGIETHSKSPSSKGDVVDGAHLTRDDAEAIAGEVVRKVGNLLGFTPGLDRVEPSLKVGQSVHQRLRREPGNFEAVHSGVGLAEGDHLRDNAFGDGEFFGDGAPEIKVAQDASPSVGDAGAHSVGEGEVAGVETAAPVTDATGVFAGPGLFRFDGSQAHTAEPSKSAAATTRQIAEVLEELHNQGNSWREIASKTRRIFTAPASPS